MSDPLPLDDVLTMARTLGRVLAEDSARLAYRKLMRRVRAHNSLPPGPVRDAVIGAYAREFRRQFNLGRKAGSR